VTEAPQTVRSFWADEVIATYAWRGLSLHVVTREPLSPDQARAIERMIPRIPSVGVFADLLGMILGRRVRIRTERPSADIRFEVGI
jgi:hypothetical protein